MSESYQVVWDGTKAAINGRYLCQDEEPTRPAPVTLSSAKGVLAAPAASSGYRIKLVLAALEQGSAAQAQLVAETAAG